MRPSSTDRRSVLLIANDDRRHARNVLQHIRALERESRHRVQTYNPVGIQRRPRGFDLAGFDVVVIHYSVVIILDSYLPQWLAEDITRFDGLKVQFIQDEYRWIDEVTARMRSLGIGLLFTLVPPAEIPKIYGERVPGVPTVPTLAGFVPEELVERPVAPLRERPIDVGYRGRTVPFWLGRFGQEKVEIGRRFLARAAPMGLRCDIAWGENDRIYGDAWDEFLSSCRATLGTESGATIADYDGSVEQAVKDHLAEHPTASFDEVEREVLAPYEGNISIKVISPRQFEAAALRTPLVLFPGSYSGILEPGRHYIPLEHDFSNFDDVVEQIRDRGSLQELADRTYEEIARSGRYSLRAFVEEFDRLVAELATGRAQPGAKPLPSRSRKRLVAGELAQRAYNVAQTVAALRVVMSERELRRTLLAYCRNPSARRVVEPGTLLNELLKLGVLAAASDGRRSFELTGWYDASRGTLVLGSRPRAAGGQVSPPRVAVPEDRLRRGELELVWNHSAVGDVVDVPLIGGRRIRVGIGYHGVNGAYSFRAVRLLAPHLPSEIVAAVNRVLGRTGGPETRG